MPALNDDDLSEDDAAEKQCLLIDYTSPNGTNDTLPISPMSQDADGGPEYDSDSPMGTGFSAHVNRPPMNQEEFDVRFGYKRPEHSHDPVLRNAGKFCRRYYQPCRSPRALWQTIMGFVPILQWLPAYQFKENLLHDCLGGLTVGVMHVPQGIAYAVLAKVAPVVGLYTSFFPPLLYMIFGTSRHNSIGSFAVVSLMAGMAVTRNCGATPLDDDPTYASYETCTVVTASTLAFTIGLVNIVMGILRLEIVATYFSDQLISGFTTAASCHVFVTQLKELFGLRGLYQPTGPGYLFRRVYHIILKLPSANWITCVISFGTIASLVIGKDYLNPVIKRRFKVPTGIPMELVVVIFATMISYLLNLEDKGVKVVNKIPTGLPDVHVPHFSIVPSLLVDALSISVVTIAVHISLAKMFAKKLHYKVDPGQELYALGFVSTLASFFPIYPVSCSLGRTLVNVDAGTKTQLSTVASSVFVAAIILVLGRLLTALPMCVLSAIVIVALKGMARKFSDLRILWPLSKIDFSIWIVSFVATVAWDVTEGLVISIIYALMTTVFRTQFPRWHFLATLSGTNDFRDSERYLEVIDHKGICVFRFDSPLLFTNVERFKQNIQAAFEQWQYKWGANSHLPEIIPVIDAETIVKLDAKIMNDMTELNVERGFGGLVYKHFVIDCSGFTFVDYMGVNALKEIFTEMRENRVLVYFAAAKAPVRDLFEASGFYKYVPKHNFYPTIRDAVAIARKRRNASTLHLLDEFRLNHEVLEDVASAQPMY
uniref:STAS domain-containing protein n=1 Tax=Panagrellus redivivus TaxID=6233 RepID=A0A7E4VES3_PANRE